MDFLPDLPALSWPATLAVAAALAFVGMFAVLVRTGRWSFRLAVGAAVVLVGALAWLIAADVRDALREFVRSVRGLELIRPWWLVLLAVVPVVVMVARRTLRGLGPFRKWFAISLRALVVALLVVALAEPRVRR